MALALRYQLTVRKSQDSIRVGGGFDAVRDDQQGAVLFAGQLCQQGHHLCAGLFIQVAGRFICQDQQRIVHQRPGKRDALLFAAGEFLGKRRPAVDQSDRVETILCLFLCLRTRDAVKFQRQADVLADGQRGD